MAETSRMPFFRWWLLGAIVFALSLSIVGLNNEGLYAAQEGRTAMIVRNMLNSGDWLTMRFDHAIPYEKPIGHYWLCLPPGWWFGLSGNPLEVSAELALRLPSALSSLLVLALSAILAWKIFNPRTAVITLFVLGSMSLFDKLGHLAHIDMPLCAAFTLAMFFLYIGYLEHGKSNPWLYGFYAALGWGMVLKGPVVIILSGLVILALMLKLRNWKLPLELRPWGGIPILLLVGLPWYVVETIRTDGAFFREFILEQNFRRFTGVDSGYRDGEFMPIWYYIPKFLTGLLPWSVFALPGLWFWQRRGWRKPLRSGTFFLLAWVVTGFVFFSCSALKRGDYLLVLYPAAGILLARVVDEVCLRLPALHRSWIWIWLGMAALLAITFGVNQAGWIRKLGEMIVDDRVPFGAKRDGMSMIMISDFFSQAWLVTLLLAAAVLGILFLLGKWLQQRRAMAAFGIVVFLIWCGFFGYHAIVEPRTDCYKTVKPLARQIQELVPENQVVAYTGIFNTELIFYVNRPYTIFSENPQPLLLAEERPAKRMLKAEPERWRVILETIPDHQYAVWFLERTESPHP